MKFLRSFYFVDISLQTDYDQNHMGWYEELTKTLGAVGTQVTRTTPSPKDVHFTNLCLARMKHRGLSENAGAEPSNGIKHKGLIADTLCQVATFV